MNYGSLFHACSVYVACFITMSLTTKNGPLTTENGPLTTKNGPLTTTNGLKMHS